MIPDSLIAELKQMKLNRLNGVPQPQTATIVEAAPSEGKPKKEGRRSAKQLHPSPRQPPVELDAAGGEMIEEKPLPPANKREEEFVPFDFNELVKEEEERFKQYLPAPHQASDKMQEESIPVPADLSEEVKPPVCPPKPKRETPLQKKQRLAHAAAERKKEKELQEKKKRTEESLKFARNTTTNIRFDISKLGLSHVRDKEPAADDLPIRRKLSNSDIDAQFNKSENLTISEMINECVCEIRGGTVFKPIAIPSIGKILSKLDIDILAKHLTSCQTFVGESQVLSEAVKVVSSICLEYWLLFLKFIGSLDSQKLFQLKNELSANRTSNIKQASDSKLERLSFDLRMVIFMANSLTLHMSDFFLKQFNELKARLLLDMMDVECTPKYFRIWFQYYQQLIDQFNASEDCKELLEKIDLKLLSKVALPDFATNKQSIIEELQSDPYVSRLVKFLERNQMKITSKYWSLLVAHISKSLEQRCPDNFAWMIEKVDLLKKFVKSGLKIRGASINKGYLLAAVKLALTKVFVKDLVEGRKSKLHDALFKEFYDKEPQIPFCIAVFQSLSQAMAIEDIKKLELKSVNSFIFNYIYKSPEENIAELKIKTSQPKLYNDVSSSLLEKVEGKNPAAIVTEIIETLTNKPTVSVLTAVDKQIKNHNDERARQKYETYPEYFRQYLLWLTLINEVYLYFLMPKRTETQQLLIKTISSRQQELKNCLSAEDYQFLFAILSNFEQMPILSLMPGMSESDSRIRMVIVHLMIVYMQLSHENEFFSLSCIGKKQLFQRDQVCAYPSAEEDKYRIIAQMVYEKEANSWGSATYDVTSLNQCSCGYYYFIGNCGRPSEETSCPECKKKIGGINHNYAASKPQVVTNKSFLEMYGRLEKQGGKKYKQRDLDQIDDSLSVRYIRGSLNFKLIELMSHARYLLEYVVGTRESIAGLIKFLGIPNDRVGEYLFGLIKIDFQAPILQFKSEVKAYNWLHCLCRSLRIDPYSIEFSKAKRNTYEKELSQKIDHFVLNSERILKEAYKNKTEDEGKVKDTIQSWVDGTVRADELVLLFPEVDLRVVTALKNNLVEPVAKEELLDKLTKYLDSTQSDPKSYSFLKFVIGQKDLLQTYQQLLMAPLNLAVHLMKRLDSKVTWKEACSLSIADLCASEDLRTMALDERLDDLIETFGNDQQLKLLHEEFAKQWQVMMALRDKYPAVFDFRFMCHSETVSEKAVTDMLDPCKAKVAYFLVTESNVESLMINSILQTLSKFQNDSLQAHSVLFSQINGIKPIRQALQQSRPEDILMLDTKIEDLIARCVKQDSASGQLSFNLDLLERAAAEELLAGKPMLEFHGSFIEYFSLHFDFNMTASKVQEIAMAVPQAPLNEQQTTYIDTLIFLNAPHIFSQFQLAVKRGSIGAARKSPTHPLHFVDDKEGFNQLSITYAQTKDFYLRIEAALFKKSTRHLDVLFLTDINPACKQQVKSHPLLQKVGPLLSSAVRRLIMRQLVGSNNEKMAQTSIKTAMEYSDVFEDSRQLPDETLIEEALSVIPSNLQLCHALSLSTLLPPPNTTN